MSEQPETNKLPMIMTAIGSVIATVAVLHFYGYLNFVHVDQQRDLESFTLSTVADAGGSLRGTPADYLAECVDGVLVMHSRRHNGLSGVLSDQRGRVVRCEGQAVPVRD
ncbi:MAG: hypothetical protein WAV92_00715 [Halopseudomonas yangmingensis]|uniref:Lipoprotein n=1 Tax=Halopseudomonas yangmingensis TaxID=1720063 RepID=A0A1I4N8M9_9GAMM|nr:hypothetical protein [Halopseudomonas yangmingensis]SFM11838.1 hypothetical protein SAMN05216217_101131 [Halopseudomonas yangmingensis]